MTYPPLNIYTSSNTRYGSTLYYTYVYFTLLSRFPENLVMFTHAQTVGTRPSFPSPQRPGYKATPNPKCANSDTSAAALSRGHALATSHDKCHVVGLVIDIEKLLRPCQS